MSVGTRLYTWWKGDLVGTDSAGNRYYREKGGPDRWVLFNGEVEASRVPPEWHAWLHRTTDKTPVERPPEVQPWEKEHQPNLTGSDLAYRPPGHVAKGGRRSKATGDYEAWTPDAA